jgi:hypothetical protein
MAQPGLTKQKDNIIKNHDNGKTPPNFLRSRKRESGLQPKKHHPS